MNRPRLHRLGPGRYRTSDLQFELVRIYRSGPRGGVLTAWKVLDDPNTYPTLAEAANSLLPRLRGWSGLSDQSGTVYLLHFDRPFGHAKHYLGWTNAESVEERLARHASGQGATLLRHVKDAGIGWQLVRVWLGGRARERQLKKQHSTRLCPVCTPRTGKHAIRSPRGRFAKPALGGADA